AAGAQANASGTPAGVRIFGGRYPVVSLVPRSTTGYQLRSLPGSLKGWGRILGLRSTALPRLHCTAEAHTSPSAISGSALLSNHMGSQPFCTAFDCAAEGSGLRL